MYAYSILLVNLYTGSSHTKIQDIDSRHKEAVSRVRCMMDEFLDVEHELPKRIDAQRHRYPQSKRFGYSYST